MAKSTDSSSITFSIGADDLRSIHDDAVEAFDAALADAGPGAVNHFIDPQRIKGFRSGGPSVWSVATVATAGGTLYLTYGFSEAIDPAQAGSDFELSVVVPGPATMWPALLLRAICRYMLVSGRVLEVGQSMPLPGAITRFFAPPHERAGYPDTAMHGIVIAADPLLPTIHTARGAVQVRRAVGVYADELQLMDSWSPAGFVASIAALSGQFVTDVARSSFAADPDVVARIEKGSREHGSEVPYVAVRGVTWSRGDGVMHVTLPGGADALRILGMARARLPFGHHLLVHDIDPDNPIAVALEPADVVTLREQGATLVVGIRPDDPLFDTLAQAGNETSVRWTLRS